MNETITIKFDDMEITIPINKEIEIYISNEEKPRFKKPIGEILFFTGGQQ